MQSTPTRLCEDRGGTIFLYHQDIRSSLEAYSLTTLVFWIRHRNLITGMRHAPGSDVFQMLRNRECRVICEGRNVELRVRPSLRSFLFAHMTAELPARKGVSNRSLYVMSIRSVCAHPITNLPDQYSAGNEGLASGALPRPTFPPQCTPHSSPWQIVGSS